MGISYEMWAVCDQCGEEKSYPGDTDDDPPWGFSWVTENGVKTGVLLCWDCHDARDGL